jgi:hypothetical protein
VKKKGLSTFHEVGRELHRRGRNNRKLRQRDWTRRSDVSAAAPADIFRPRLLLFGITGTLESHVRVGDPSIPTHADVLVHGSILGSQHGVVVIDLAVIILAPPGNAQISESPQEHEDCQDLPPAGISRCVHEISI